MLSDPNQSKSTATPDDAPEAEALPAVMRPEKPAERRGLSGNVLVMALLAIDVALGGATAAAGYYLLESPAIALIGAGMGTVGVFLMLIFQLFGRER